MMASLSQNSCIISGLRAAFVRNGIRLNILILALLYGGGPLGAFTLFRKIRAKRESVRGVASISRYVKASGRYFFSENIPGWPSAAFNGFFRDEVRRAMGEKAALSTIIFAITSRCSLGCKHCYERKNISNTEKLSSSDLKVILEKIQLLGIRHIQLSGGEPLERFGELVELVKLSGGKADVWILTSGMHLTFEKALTLKKAGLTGADISLDSWNEQAHNFSRNNPGSFRWVHDAIINCRRAGLATSLSLCAFRKFVTEDNLMLYAALAKDWGAGFIRLLEPRIAGRYSGNDVLLIDEQVTILEKFFTDLNMSAGYRGYPVVTYPGYAQRRTGCSGSGNRYLYIDSSGAVHACPFCQAPVGNAVSGKLEDAIEELLKKGCHEFSMNVSDQG